MRLDFLLLTLLLVAIFLVIQYFIIRMAVIAALQRARREDWTERYDPEHAHWLTQEQRDTLAAQRDNA